MDNIGDTTFLGKIWIQVLVQIPSSYITLNELQEEVGLLVVSFDSASVPKPPSNPCAGV